MRRTWKRVFALFLCLVMCLSLLPLAAAHAAEFTDYTEIAPGFVLMGDQLVETEHRYGEIVNEDFIVDGGEGDCVTPTIYWRSCINVNPVTEERCGPTAEQAHAEALQRMMNELFSMTPQGSECTLEMTQEAIRNILRANEFSYQSTLFQLPPKQKELLIAICKEGKAQNLTSSEKKKKYHLPGSSSVQSATKGLLEKNFITATLGVYEVYDRFFSMWLTQQA